MGLGYVVDSVGAYSNLVPYTAFNARKSYIENNPEIIQGFRNAINKGLEYTYTHNSKDLARIIINMFPDTSLDDLETIIERYKKADSWLIDTNIKEELFTNLEDILIDGNLISKYVPYQDLIINE